MKDEKMIEALNRMLSQEHACAIRYATHAAVVTGPYADTVQARLKEISTDEVSHAEKLRDRILALGGMPTLEVSGEDLKSAKTLQQILSINIEEEKEAIRQTLQQTRFDSPFGKDFQRYVRHGIGLRFRR